MARRPTRSTRRDTAARRRHALQKQAAPPAPKAPRARHNLRSPTTGRFLPSKNLKFDIPENYGIAMEITGLHSEREIRKEYTRLRDIMRKRLQRLEKAGEITEDRLRRIRENLKPLREMKSAREVYGAIKQAAYAVYQPDTTTVSGIRSRRADVVERMQKSGYDFVTMENWRDFSEYMKSFQRFRKSAGRNLDSDTIAQLFGAAKEKKIDPALLAEDFEKWIQIKPADFTGTVPEGVKTAQELREAFGWKETEKHHARRKARSRSRKVKAKGKGRKR